MKINKLSAALALLAINGAWASQVSIDEVIVSDNLYPEKFAAELQNNLNFFRDGVGVDVAAKVPYDTIFIRDGKTVDPAYYVNSTEIGFYLNVLVEMEKAGNKDALVRISEVLDTMDNAPNWNGLFFWPYNIVDGQLETTKEGVVPAVDNANFVFSLLGVAGAFLDSEEPAKQKIVQRIEERLQMQKKAWAQMYDPSRKLLRAGINGHTGENLTYFIDRKANESRLAPLWAALITKDLGEKAVPQEAFNNMELYTTEYKIKGKKYTPMLTWDGAYFQGMLPSIYLDEKVLMPDYSIVEDMTYIQKLYAREYNIPLVSSSATVDDRYAPYGIPYIAEKKVKFGHDVHDDKTGTPHATALSYMVDPDMAIEALLGIKSVYPEVESDFGWYDAIKRNGEMSTKILSLDQGMFVGAFMS
ncbi:hypothetical protein RCJ22_29945, partial [Vibrio sp. FNV 38]|nr:hypothetical protein [Vibrio sp. FNV 38]